MTDADLNILGEGIDVVIHAPDEALAEMIEVVAQMHNRSGLVDEVRSTIDVPAAEELVLDYIRTHVKQARRLPRQLDCHRPRLHHTRYASAG